jgi:hypothetical protein
MVLSPRVSIGALLATALLGSAPASIAQSAGCDYWDRFETSDIQRRLENIRARWLAIRPTRAQIQAEFQKEVEIFRKAGHKNAVGLAEGQGEDFYIRRVRMSEYARLHDEPETDEELWVYCVSGKTDCANFFRRMNRPARFDKKGALAEDDPALRAGLDELRKTVSEFNLYAQIVAFTYCDCDGSSEAVAVCNAARRMLLRDF